ncbi:MAG: AAA family ATPase [Dehalococcoidia bacterium]
MNQPSGPAVTCPVLVGRASIVAALQQSIDGIEDAHPPVALLSGEAGIGKSRLVAEVKRYAAERGVLIIEGACFPQDHACPYAPLLDMIRARLAGLPSPERRQRTGAYLPELQPLLPTMFPTASDLSRESEADSEHARRRLFEGLSHLLTGDTEGRPMLLVIEDLHWSDDASLDVLMHIARRAAGQPVLLIATYRADETSPSLRHWLGELDRARLAQEFPLGPLNRDDVAAMVRAILDDGRAIPASFVDAVDALAEGNPFFVEEFVGSMIGDAGLPAGSDDRRLTSIAGREWRIPRSVHACLIQRVLRIGAPAQEVLRLAAVVGRRFNYTLLERLAGLDERTLVTLIKEMVAGNLVVEESPEVFTFRHALIQQAVYGELLGRERIALHRIVAEHAEEVFDTDTEQHHADLAYHFFQAEMWDKALVYARRAGEQALRLYAPQIAVEQFSRSLDAARRLTSEQGDEGQELITALRPGLFLGRGRAYETLGDFDRAKADYESAVDLAGAARNDRTQWTALIDLGLLWAGRDYAEAGRRFEAALALARSTGDPALIAHSLNRVGNQQVNAVEPWDALSLHREALSLFENLDDRRGIATTLDLLGVASFLSADLPASVSYLERAAALFREMDDRHGLASSLAMLAVRAGSYEMDMFSGDAADADLGLAQAQEAVALARSINWRAGEAFALFQCGPVLGLRGEHARALDTVGQSLRLAEEIGHVQWQTGARTLLTALYLDLLAVADAQHHAEQAYRLARTIGSSFWQHFSMSLLAQAYLIGGERSRAESLLSDASDQDNGLPIRSLGRWWVNFVRVQLHLAGGRPADALRLIDRAARPDPDGPATRETPRLALYRAESLLALGRIDEAYAVLTAVQAAAIRKAARPLLWRTHVVLGNTFRARGQHDEARRELVAARTIIEELAGNLVAGPVRDAFLQHATAQLPRSYRLSPQRVAAARSGGLTARERQVAALVAQGKSNRQIAEALVLGERTVETHVSNVLAKLGAGSRQEITAWMASQDAGDMQ